MIYRFRLTFPAAKEFVRDYDISATQTLYDLHRCIQDDLDYDEAQPVRFYTADKDWKSLRSFSLTGAKKTAFMDEVTLDSIVPTQCYQLIYTFDVINKRSFHVELLDMFEAEPGKRYPRLVLEKGEIPGQIGKANSKLSSIFDQALPEFDDSIYSASDGDD